MDKWWVAQVPQPGWGRAVASKCQYPHLRFLSTHSLVVAVVPLSVVFAVVAASVVVVVVVVVAASSGVTTSPDSHLEQDFAHCSSR